MTAGEPLNVNVLGEWREATGLTIREGYGPAPYRYPRDAEFMDELPKTPPDKILRPELRKRS